MANANELEELYTSWYKNQVDPEPESLFLDLGDPEVLASLTAPNTAPEWVTRCLAYGEGGDSDLVVVCPDGSCLRVRRSGWEDEVWTTDVEETTAKEIADLPAWVPDRLRQPNPTPAAVVVAIPIPQAPEEPWYEVEIRKPKPPPASVMSRNEADTVAETVITVIKQRSNRAPGNRHDREMWTFAERRRAYEAVAILGSTARDRTEDDPAIYEGSIRNAVRRLLTRALAESWAAYALLPEGATPSTELLAARERALAEERVVREARDAVLLWESASRAHNDAHPSSDDDGHWWFGND